MSLWSAAHSGHLAAGLVAGGVALAAGGVAGVLGKVLAAWDTLDGRCCGDGYWVGCCVAFPMFPYTGSLS